jgi:hypothetical protein
MKKTIIVSIIFLAIFSTEWVLSAQDFLPTEDSSVQLGTLFCTVQCNGVCIDNATVKVYQGTTLITEGYTDSAGKYDFSLVQGAYDLVISKTGYKTINQKGVIITPNQTVSIPLPLIPTTLENKQGGKLTTLGDNLFNPRTGGTSKVTVNVQQSGNITIKICDLKGRLVRSVVDNSQYVAGSYQFSWDGKDDGGTAVPPGIYILYYKYPGGSETRKIGVE